MTLPHITEEERDAIERLNKELGLPEAEALQLRYHEPCKACRAHREINLYGFCNSCWNFHGMKERYLAGQ